MATKARPLSPHLQVYRPQITSVMSISHRITGVALAAGTLLLVCWIGAAASGAEGYATVQGFIGSMFRQEPSELIAQQDLPVLIVNGREDLQTPASDAETLAAARPDATIILMDGVNHVLKQVPAGDRAANLASYSDPDLPLAPGLADAIAGFVQADR